MDNVVVALGLGIAIVAVLLMSCWKGGKKSYESSCSGMESTQQVAQSSKQVPGDKADFGWSGLSTTGTGVINRELAQQYKDLKDVSQYGDYGSLTQLMALEPEVFESNAEYNSSMNRSTSGPSTMTVRSDSADIINWRGLRRPDYQSVYSASDARVTSSQYIDQMPAATRYLV